MSVEHVVSFLNHAWIILLAAQMGLAASFGDIAASLQRRALVGRILAANCLLIPLIAYGLLRLLGAHPYVSAGFLTLILFPGAIFGPALTALGKGDAPLSVGLMILFSCVSLVISPFLLNFLLRALLPGAADNIEIVKIARLIFLAQILPLSLGLAIQRASQTLAQRLLPGVKKVTSLLGLCVCVLVLATKLPSLEIFGLKAFSGMAALFCASLAIGWIIGGPSPRSRVSAAMSCSGRNVALALAITAGAFPGTPAATAVLAYAIVSLSASFLAARLMGKRSGQEAAFTS